MSADKCLAAGGVLVTDDLVDRLVAEAEDGYDVEANSIKVMPRMFRDCWESAAQGGALSPVTSP